jgi:AraC-like DNA-binding protein
MTTKRRGWPGFERIPEGRLLEQQVDLDASLGLAYERSLGFSKPYHTHDRPMFVCPRGACVMRVRARPPEQVFELDARHLLYVPAGVEHDNGSVSTVYDTLALYPSKAMVTASVGSRLPKGLREPVLVKRSGWLDELLDRFVCARILQRQRRISLLESSLTRELFDAVLPTAGARLPRREPVPVPSKVLDQALRLIEGRLFQPLSLEDMCRHVGVSTSSLLRLFRSELKLTPQAYKKGRRLDEARRLLSQGSCSVEEACWLVGYSDPATFSRSFKQRFGQSPSHFSDRGAKSPTRAR